MNHCVPDWKMEDDSRQFHDLLPASNQKKMIGQEDDLIELVWKNGHVVLHSQTNCRAPATTSDSKQAQKPETMLKCGVSLGNSSKLIQEDETASWLQNPLDDPLDKEFLEFFCDILNADPDVNDKANKGEKYEMFSSIKGSDTCPKHSSLHPKHSMKLPSKPPVFVSAKHSPCLENGAVLNFSHHTKSERAEMGPAIWNFDGVASGSQTVVRIGEPSSMRTTESSICGSNQVQNHVEASHTSSNDKAVKEDSLLGSAQICRQTTTFDPMVASSSGGSGCSFGRIGQESTTSHGHKRKGREAEESECHIEDAEQELIEANKDAQRSAPSRRSRASEVHNLSERRRRDKINEKMRALQELIPHCNKSDKASMLDEAIEYLKSLQLQVQIMWMGSGMAPMLFPSVQQYMSRMGIGTGHPSFPSIPNPVQLRGSMLINQSIPSISTPNHPLACPSPGIVPLNFPNQLPDICLPEPFSHYLSFPHMQMPTQVMDMNTYASQVMQLNQTAAASDINHMPSVGASSENIQSGQPG